MALMLLLLLFVYANACRQTMCPDSGVACVSPLQERLTNTIAQAHAKTTGEAQEWVRLMLSCVGRGGDGQRIRDEILHIMHR